MKPAAIWCINRKLNESFIWGSLALLFKESHASLLTLPQPWKETPEKTAHTSSSILIIILFFSLRNVELFLLLFCSGNQRQQQPYDLILWYLAKHMLQRRLSTVFLPLLALQVLWNQYPNTSATSLTCVWVWPVWKYVLGGWQEWVRHRKKCHSSLISQRHRLKKN